MWPQQVWDQGQVSIYIIHKLRRQDDARLLPMDLEVFCMFVRNKVNWLYFSLCFDDHLKEALSEKDHKLDSVESLILVLGACFLI